MGTALQVMSFDEMTRLAEAIAQSGLFGMKNTSQALSLMAISAAEGVSPALAARDFHVIQGRPTLKADAMLARFQQAGGKVRFLSYTDDKVEAEFSHPQGGTLTIDWTTERAKRAGLAGRDSWKNYPRQMLRARVLSEGIRAIFPGATSGMMVPEEAQDIPTPIERDITPPPAPMTGVAALQARLAKAAETATEPATEAAGESLPDPTLLDLRSQALDGTKALQAAWERLTPIHRKSLAEHLPALKAAAAEADNVTTEPQAA